MISMISTISFISMYSIVLSVFSWFPFVGVYLRSFSGHFLYQHQFFWFGWPVYGWWVLYDTCVGRVFRFFPFIHIYIFLYIYIYIFFIHIFLYKFWVVGIVRVGRVGAASFPIFPHINHTKCSFDRKYHAGEG